MRFDWLSNIDLCECAAPGKKKNSLQLIVKINWNGVEAATAAAVITTKYTYGHRIWFNYPGKIVG